MLTWFDCYKECLTVEEAADEMNCSKRTAAKMLRKQALALPGKAKKADEAVRQIAERAAGGGADRSSFPSSDGR